MVDKNTKKTYCIIGSLKKEQEEEMVVMAEEKDPYAKSREIRKKFGYSFVGIYSQNLAKARRQEQVWFHVDIDGKPIYAEMYEYVHDFVNGFALVKKDGLWSFIRPDGTFLNSEWYEDADNFSNGFAAVKKKGLWSHLKTDGTLAHNRWFEWVLDFRSVKGFKKEELVATVKEPDQGRKKGEIFDIRTDGTSYSSREAPKAQ